MQIKERKKERQKEREGNDKREDKVKGSAVIVHNLVPLPKDAGLLEVQLHLFNWSR